MQFAAKILPNNRLATPSSLGISESTTDKPISFCQESQKEVYVIVSRVQQQELTIAFRLKENPPALVCD